jgi:uncharacterized protein (TIGR03083 family)
VLTKDRYLDTVRQEGDRIVAVGRAGDLAAPVPATPDWDLAGLIAHTSFVHRYVSAWMDAGAPQKRDVVPEPSGDVVDWFAAGVDGLIARLDAADPDARVPTFIGPATNMFWIRRMAHETAMHRHDAEEAVGGPGPVPTDIAIDGIDEFLTGFHLPHRIGGRFAGSGETLHFHATDGDGEWFLTRTAEGVDVERRHGKADVAARGTGHDLLMFVWSRAGTEHLEVFGDESLLTSWQDCLDP